MVGVSWFRDVKLITEIMQIADRARFSPAAWPQADMHPTSCSCLICIESSVKSCGSERDPVIHSVLLAPSMEKLSDMQGFF